MSFLNPWGFLFALSIPGIIILYLLKQQHEDITISSTFLWDRTIESMEASIPWQKLRRNILMILQILALALLTLAISRPVLVGPGQGHNYIVILDSSASMQARDLEPSRFEKAHRDIEELIEAMLPDQTMTLIEAANEAKLIVSQSKDKSTLRAGLKEIKVTNETANIEEAFSLVQGLLKDGAKADIYLYTDQNYPIDVMEGMGYKTMVYNGGGDNRAVQSVTYSYDSDTPIVLSTIVNYGGSSTITVECLADHRLVDVKEVSIGEGEIANIYWDSIPVDAKSVEIRIPHEDDLMVDNRGWVAITPPTTNKVLLVTSRNTFLEKAIAIRKDIELYKTTFEEAEDMGDYDLYVYDGYIPSKLPEDGSLVIFNPIGENPQVKMAGTFSPGTIELNGQSRYRDMMTYIRPEEFHIAKAGILEVPDWAEVVLQDREHPIMLMGEKGNQRIAVFPFDIHNSDLPLKADFPILMQNLMGWMLPQIVDNSIQNHAGKEVIISPLPQAERVKVISPSGEATEIGPPFPLAPFTGTQEVGLYRVDQKVGDKVAEGYFTLHIQVSQESDLRLSQGTMTETENQEHEKPDSPGGKSLWHYFIWMALAIMLVEWWVYQRGYY